MRNDDKECMMGGFRKTVRYLKTILKLEDVLEEHKPCLLDFSFTYLLYASVWADLA